MSDAKDLAVRFVTPRTTELVQIDADRRPLAPTEVAGRTIFSLISPGTELAGYNGLWTWAKWPFDCGYAAIFAVEQVGAEVKDMLPGRLAFCMGSHRLFQRHQRRDVVPLPEALEPRTAVFARMMGVTMTTLVTTTARPPDAVLVTGLGLIGNLGAQVFHACGYAVVACDLSAPRRELAARCGIRDVRPAVPLDDAALTGRVALVLECSGHEQAVLDGCRMVRKRGEVSMVGVPWAKRTDLPAFDVLHAVFHRYVTLRSGWEWELPHHAADFRDGSIFGNFASAMEWLRGGRIEVSPLADVRSPRDARQVYDALATGSAPALTTLFDWRKL